MSKEKQLSNVLHNLLLTEVESVDSLAELALDMRWSWHHAADALWRQLNPALWEVADPRWFRTPMISLRSRRIVGHQGYDSYWTKGLLRSSVSNR